MGGVMSGGGGGVQVGRGVYTAVSPFSLSHFGLPLNAVGCGRRCKTFTAAASGVLWSPTGNRGYTRLR